MVSVVKLFLPPILHGPIIAQLFGVYCINDKAAVLNLFFCLFPNMDFYYDRISHRTLLVNVNTKHFIESQ